MNRSLAGAKLLDQLAFLHFLALEQPLEKLHLRLQLAHLSQSLLLEAFKGIDLVIERLDNLGELYHFFSSLFQQLFCAG